MATRNLRNSRLALGARAGALHGPQVLIDNKAELDIAEVPAIILYGGETLNLMPDKAELRAMTMKIVNDANDVIDEIALNGGDHMWSETRWEEYMPRLPKGMSTRQDTGRRYGLGKGAGHILGGEAPSLADAITVALWTTMAERFSRIDDLFGSTAPMTAAIRLRVSALPALAKLSERDVSTMDTPMLAGRLAPPWPRY